MLTNAGSSATSTQYGDATLLTQNTVFQTPSRGFSESVADCAEKNRAVFLGFLDKLGSKTMDLLDRASEDIRKFREDVDAAAPCPPLSTNPVCHSMNSACNSHKSRIL